MATAGKVRVYELARDLGLSNKDLMTIMEREGFAVRSHSSSLEEETAAMLRDLVMSDRNADKKKAAAPAPAAPAPAALAAKPAPAAAPAVAEEAKELHLKTPITVRDLAEGLGRKPNELVLKLMTMNVFATINQVIDEDQVSKLCDSYGVKFVRVRRDRKAAEQAAEEQTMEKEMKQEEQASRNLVSRPPVVVFMGHVDHGKTSIQDYIRKTSVTKGEAGGITQHIGASVVSVGKQSITFLDTPGHEAFTAMRARGANATDIAVLVVAADDGVMPQTVEAIHHAQAAKVPIVVAMNKMDLPGAKPEKVYVGLQKNGILPEDFGGEVAVIPVSAKTGQGMPDLLERILLEAEMLDLKADPTGEFRGLVIEAQMENGMGPTASVLVQNGTLHVGDVLLGGQIFGRVKALIDSLGRRVNKALPSTPIRVLGLSGVPESGDMMTVCDSEKEARELAEEARRKAQAESQQPVTKAVSLDTLFENLNKEEKPNLNLIVKTDVFGSLEAIKECIGKIKSDKVTATVIHGGVGEITDNDVILASASKAVILGFHVRAMPGVNKLAKQKGVEIRLYSIIYELLDQVETAMRGQLTPEINEKLLGRAEIIQIFENSKVGKICGCRVNDGLIRVNAKAKVYRDKELIYHGQIQSLKHFKDDVHEVKSGLECGIKLDNFEDFEEHDVIEVYESVQIAPEL